MLRINCTRFIRAGTERAPSGAIATIGITGIIGKVCPAPQEFLPIGEDARKIRPRAGHAATSMRAEPTVARQRLERASLALFLVMGQSKILGDERWRGLTSY